MVAARRLGRSTLGCLVTLLLVVAAGYFAFDVGDAYWRYYRFRDAMVQQARFAAQISDAEIARRLAATADSLGLPDTAAAVDVRRTGDSVTIASDYQEVVKLPFAAREIAFHPRVRRGL